MRTKYGNISSLFPRVTNLAHNLITNEVSGVVAFYTSEENATSGEFEPIHQQHVSWIIDSDNSTTLQAAIDTVVGQ